MKLLIGALLGVTTLTACGTGSVADPPAGGGGDPLADRTFLSTAVSGSSEPLVHGTRITLTFADGQLGASAGCNTMGGDYALGDDTLRLPGSLFMTEMGCDEPRMAQDEWVSAFLGGDPSYALDDDTLTLTAGRTTLELVDGEVADPDRSLTGTEWVLTGIVSGSAETGAVSTVPAGVRSTLQFDADTVFARYACNGGSGQVRIGDRTLTIPGMSSTHMFCAGTAGMVEKAVLATLTGTSEWSVDARSLSIQQGGSGLLYQAAGRH